METARATGLHRGLEVGVAAVAAGAPVHEPGKVLLDLATAITLGGDRLAEIGRVWAQEELFGRVAPDPTASRLIDRLAADRPTRSRSRRSKGALAAARAHHCPVPDDGLVPVDLDGSVQIAHSEERAAAPTVKRTFGFHPLLAFVDHTPDLDRWRWGTAGAAGSPG